MRTIFEYTTHPGAIFWPIICIQGDDSQFFASIECEIESNRGEFYYYSTSMRVSPRGALVELLLDFLQGRFKQRCELPNLLEIIILPAMLKYERG